MEPHHACTISHELLDAMCARARRWIGPRLKPMVDPEDLVQEALLRLGPEAWRGGRLRICYVDLVMRRMAAGLARRARRFERAAMALLREPRPEERVPDDDLLDVLQLGRLDLSIILLYRDGYDCAEISRRLNRSHASIRQRLRRIRLRAAALLGQGGP